MEKINLSRDLERIELFADTPINKKAVERFKRVGLPSRKMEEYRYFNIDKLLKRDFTLIDSASAKEIKESDRVVITDGVVTEICGGVTVGCSNTLKLAEEHFDPLYYLGHTLSGDIISLRFKKDSTVKIEHRFTKSEALLSYRIAIYLDRNSYVTVEESFHSDGAESSLLLFGYDVFVSKDSTFKLIKSETLSEESYTSIASHNFEIEDGASMVWRSFDFGDGSGLQLAQTTLGKRASIESTHLLFATREANRGTVSKFIHNGEHSTSGQIAKTVLQDGAKGIFDALIRVTKEAKFTKAHQNSKAILLNDGAYMASKPQLEIYIDELEASHGSTTGELDEKALFYLLSRGISLIDAKKMLILAFANELIDMVESSEIRNSIYRDFEIFYYGETKIECIKSCHNCEEMILI
jgi:Fe-S cluster assembly protein SufD